MTSRAPEALKRLNPIDFTFNTIDNRSVIPRGCFICQSHLCNCVRIQCTPIEGLIHQQIQACFKRLKAKPTARLQSKIVTKFQILSLNNFFLFQVGQKAISFRHFMAFLI